MCPNRQKEPLSELLIVIDTCLARILTSTYGDAEVIGYGPYVLGVSLISSIALIVIDKTAFWLAA